MRLLVRRTSFVNSIVKVGSFIRVAAVFPSFLSIPASKWEDIILHHSAQKNRYYRDHPPNRKMFLQEHFSEAEMQAFIRRPRGLVSVERPKAMSLKPESDPKLLRQMFLQEHSRPKCQLAQINAILGKPKTHPSRSEKCSCGNIPSNALIVVARKRREKVSGARHDPENLALTSCWSSRRH